MALAVYRFDGQNVERHAVFVRDGNSRRRRRLQVLTPTDTVPPVTAWPYCASREIRVRDGAFESGPHLAPVRHWARDCPVVLVARWFPSESERYESVQVGHYITPTRHAARPCWNPPRRDGLPNRTQETPPRSCAMTPRTCHRTARLACRTGSPLDGLSLPA